IVLVEQDDELLRTIKRDVGAKIAGKTVAFINEFTGVGMLQQVMSGCGSDGFWRQVRGLEDLEGPTAVQIPELSQGEVTAYPELTEFVDNPLRLFREVIANERAEGHLFIPHSFNRKQPSNDVLLR